MALGKIYAALEQMFGGRINARAATSGQVLTKQSDGTWAGAAAASSGPTYNSTTDVLGGTPDWVVGVIFGNQASPAQNVRATSTYPYKLSLLGGDASNQYVTIASGGGINVDGGTHSGGNAGAVLACEAGNASAAGSAAINAGPAVDGDAGQISLYVYDAVGTNKNGGDVYLHAGAGTGTGTPGAVKTDTRFSTAKGGDIASAKTLTLGADGNFFKITGTTTINGIVTLGWQAGSVIHLMFTGALTVTHASGAPGTGAVALLLNAAANMTTAANNTLTLVYDGTNWVELARKV